MGEVNGDFLQPLSEGAGKNVTKFAPVLANLLPTEGTRFLEPRGEKIKENVDSLGTTPLLSSKLDPKAYLRAEAVAALSAQRLFEDSKEPVWVNINIHTMPPVNLSSL